jgi:hypothetical protein
VLAIDPVGDVGRVGQCLETVRAAGRHVQRLLLLAGQPEALPVPVGRRTRPQVDDDVEDGAVGAAHQLGLAPPTAQVQPADHAAGGPGDAVLHKCRGIKPGRPRHRRVERPGKETALVGVRNRAEKQRAVDPRDLQYLHDPSLVLPAKW